MYGNLKRAEVVEFEVGRHIVAIRKWNWGEIRALVVEHGFCVVGDTEELLPVKGHADWWMALAEVAEGHGMEAYASVAAPWQVEVRFKGTTEDR